MFLTHARLRRDQGVAALAPLLLPNDPDQRLMAEHRLVWSLFADTPDRRRDFLWRAQDSGTFYTLSARPPHDSAGLFVLDEPKVFEPALAAGDRLAFMLRANPVLTKSAGSGRRGKRQGVVTAALAKVPQQGRAEHRRDTIVASATSWLSAQGERHGFALLEPVSVEGDQCIRIPRPGMPQVQFDSIDFAGRLIVRDPAAFLAAVARGFGKAKAFGCGLMLIRRA
jgi:CRISPR system Cascade subunit CasE